MKYYLIEISTGDEKIAGKAIYEYDNEQTAIANFHSKLGTAMKSELYHTELVIVIDDKSNVIKTETFENVNYISPSEPVEEI